MCNLYRLKTGPAEIGALFRVKPQPQLNFAAEVYPGYEGLVVAHGTMRVMTWGFPLVMKGRDGKALKPKPVNNARTDKLASPFWRASMAERRCLIPLTAWAEAEGPKGRMTRTWVSMADGELFAAAGIWRASAEWGDCYSMVMTDSAPSIADLHTRMPVLLHADDWDRWQSAPVDEAMALCRPWDSPLAVDRTDQPWGRKPVS